MPTNFIRSNDRAKGKAASRRSRPSGRPRQIELQAGTVLLPLELMETPTADRIFAALPLFSKAEPWGAVLHFRLPIGTGRDRSARLNARPGEVYFWSEEDRVIIPFGPTPISRQGEIRLPRPCNTWAMAVGDVGILQHVSPSAKVTLRVATS